MSDAIGEPVLTIKGIKGVEMSDPVTREGHAYFGSFLDSEGNKLWFCSFD